MMFLDPHSVNCPRCVAKSQHTLKDLFAFVAVCPACGASLEEIGRRMSAQMDETCAFVTWAEVLMGVEDRLGITTPGIPDGEVFGTKPYVELTLRDLARSVAEHLQPSTDANQTAHRLVLESAENVAGRPVMASDFDRPLLRALGIPLWAEGRGRTSPCT
jgi:hypothetical protein